MSKLFFPAFCLCLVVNICSCSTTPGDVKNTPDEKFFIACKSGNVDAMAAVVKRLAQQNKIHKGMTPGDIEKILGTPVHFTGIYCPGGISYGYGNVKPTVQNYFKFYWIHLKPEKPDSDNYVLFSWD